MFHVGAFSLVEGRRNLMRTHSLSALVANRPKGTVIYIHRCSVCGRPETRRESIEAMMQGPDDSCLGCQQKRLRKARVH